MENRWFRTGYTGVSPEQCTVAISWKLRRKGSELVELVQRTGLTGGFWNAVSDGQRIVAGRECPDTPVLCAEMVHG